MDISARIREIMEQKGISQVRLAEKLQISQPFLSQQISGKKKISLDSFFEFCNALEITPFEFFRPFSDEKHFPTYINIIVEECKKIGSQEAAEALLPIIRFTASQQELKSINNHDSEVSPEKQGNNSEEEEEEEEDEEPKYYLPLLGEAAAGSPIYRPADDGDAVVVPECYADSDRYAVFQARGDSMEPRIPDGAFIVTEVNVLPADGEVAVVMLSSFSDAEYVVKRVYRKRNSAILRSYNPKYTDMEVAADEVRSAYRMVEIIR